MSDNKYLYGISTVYLEIRKTRILKETKKMIKVESYITPYDTIWVYKSDCNLARTEAEAIVVFVHNQKTTIKHLKTRIELLELDISKAKAL